MTGHDLAIMLLEAKAREYDALSRDAAVATRYLPSPERDRRMDDANVWHEHARKCRDAIAVLQRDADARADR